MIHHNGDLVENKLKEHFQFWAINWVTCLRNGDVIVSMAGEKAASTARQLLRGVLHPSFRVAVNTFGPPYRNTAVYTNR